MYVVDSCVCIVRTISAYEWVCVCIHVCGHSVCIMSSHRDSRVVVKGVSSLAHHTSHSHFQTEQSPQRRREALWSGSDKTLPPPANRTSEIQTFGDHHHTAGKCFSKGWNLCPTAPVLIQYLLHKNIMCFKKYSPLYQIIGSAPEHNRWPCAPTPAHNLACGCEGPIRL